MLRPFSLTLTQSLLLGVLLQTILCWAVNLINRNITSGYLLLCFLFIGDATPLQVFNFIISPAVFFSRNVLFFSDSFILITASFMLSTAITKTGLLGRIAEKTFVKFAKSPLSIVRFSFIAGTLLIFLIPMPFPRVLIMAALYLTFFEKIAISQKTKTVLLYSIFFASASCSALFINGDIVLGNAAVAFAGTSLSYPGWIKYMFVPSFLMVIASYFIFIKLFGIKNEVFEFLPERDLSSPERKSGIPEKLLPNEKKVIVTSALLIVLWLTERLHGISAAHCAGIMVIVLFILGILKFSDLKTVNPSLILFITAAFAIGRVFSVNSVAETVNTRVFQILPDPQSIFYYMALALVVMILHIFIGGVAATMSVVVPTLAGLPGADPVTMALLAFSVINMQFFLPLHHMTILLGAGKGYYSQNETIRTGICFFFVMLIYVPFVLVQWWRIIL